MLLSGLYHRIRKNLIDSELSPPEALTPSRLQEDGYLKSLAVMHARLYECRSLTRIDFSDYLHHLVKSVFMPLVSDRPEIEVKVNSGCVHMDLDSAALCGSLIAELVINALQHAFPAGRTGEVLVELWTDDSGQYRLVVQDNGIGLHEDSSSDHEETAGLSLIKMLVDQLNGRMEVACPGGTSFYITFSGTSNRASV